MQIRILTIFAKFGSIQLTFWAKSPIKVPRNTSFHLECTKLIKLRRISNNKGLSAPATKFLLQNSGIPKMLKRLRPNPGNWRWILRQLCWPVIWTDKADATDEKNFNADTTDEKKFFITKFTLRFCWDNFSFVRLSGEAPKVHENPHKITALKLTQY